MAVNRPQRVWTALCWAADHWRRSRRERPRVRRVPSHEWTACLHRRHPRALLAVCCGRSEEGEDFEVRSDARLARWHSDQGRPPAHTHLERPILRRGADSRWNKRNVGCKPPEPLPFSLAIGVTAAARISSPLDRLTPAVCALVHNVWLMTRRTEPARFSLFKMKDW